MINTSQNLYLINLNKNNNSEQKDTKNQNNYGSNGGQSTLHGSNFENNKLDPQIPNNIPQYNENQKSYEIYKPFESNRDNYLLLNILQSKMEENTTPEAKKTKLSKEFRIIFEKTLAKTIAESFVNNMLRFCNKNEFYDEIIKNNFPNANEVEEKAEPIQEHTKFSKILCSHKNRPHYAKVNIFYFRTYAKIATSNQEETKRLCAHIKIVHYMP